MVIISILSLLRSRNLFNEIRGSSNEVATSDVKEVENFGYVKLFRFQKDWTLLRRRLKVFSLTACYLSQKFSSYEVNTGWYSEPKWVIRYIQDSCMLDDSQNNLVYTNIKNKLSQGLLPLSQFNFGPFLHVFFQI